MIPKPRRDANATERAAAVDVAADAARMAKLGGKSPAGIANAVTKAVHGSVDAENVKPSSLDDIANAAHRAAQVEASMVGATYETVSEAVRAAASHVIS